MSETCPRPVLRALAGLRSEILANGLIPKSTGKGWVGAVGPHPEADKSWYAPYKLRNPDGINFDIG